MPPSSNQIYAPIFKGNVIRMVKAKVYRSYETEVMKWLMSEREQVSVIRSFIKDIGEYVLHVDAKFWMLHTEIVTLKGKPKKNDTANRLKALHDVLSDLIMGIDDSYFWSGSFSKESLGALTTTKPYVDIDLTLRTI